MKQAPQFAADLSFGRAYRVDESPWLPRAERAERQALNEALPVLAYGFVADCIFRNLAEVVDRSAAPRGSDDSVVRRHKPRVIKVKESWQKLATGKVSERTEEDDDVRIRNRCAAHAHPASIAP